MQNKLHLHVILTEIHGINYTQKNIQNFQKVLICTFNTLICTFMLCIGYFDLERFLS